MLCGPLLKIKQWQVQEDSSLSFFFLFFFLSLFVFAFSSNVKAEGKNVLEVVSRLVLRLGGCEVVLQEGLQVLEGGPLLRVFLPALQHELVQRDGAVLGAGHPVASIHLFQHLAVVHAWKAQRGWGGAGKPSKRKQAGAARHDHAYLASIPPSVICHVQQMAREMSHRGKLDIKSDKGAPGRHGALRLKGKNQNAVLGLGRSPG